LIKVLLTERLNQRAFELLKEIPEFEIDFKPNLNPQDLKKEISKYDAVVINGNTTLDADTLQYTDQLKIIIKAGIDLDNIDVDTAKSKNIIVRNTPFATSISVAEYTLAHMLGISRFIGPVYKSMKEHEWEKAIFSQGIELFGKTAGIIGFGRIGREVAKRELIFGMKVVYYDIVTIDTDIDAKSVSFQELLNISDFISIHLPLINSTKTLLSSAEFELMKENVVIINTTRGNVFHEDSLLDALNQKKIRAVALNVREDDLHSKSNLIDHERVFPSPFLGSLTKEGQERTGMDIISQLKDFFNV
jgi:D-3-phosphoglycerate dehydrogenase